MLALVVLLPFVLALNTQKQSEQANIFLNLGIPVSCQTSENNIASMEVLAKMASEQTKDGGVLIVVARLGKGERSREYNRRRLYNVREFLKNYSRIQPENIVVAEGERVAGFGQIEFYLGGERIGKFLFERDKDLCLICCDEYGPYYPQKDNSDSKGRRRQKRVSGRGDS